MKKRLIIEYFKHPNEDRHKEVVDTINANIRSDLFDEVVVFHEGAKPKDLSKRKLVTLVKAPRTTFADRFKYANEHFDKGDICIVANSDIVFNETINEAEKMGDNNFFALTRFEEDEGHRGSINSQDVWITRTPIRESLIEKSDFELGRSGCDNAIAFNIVESGYYLENPSLLIKTYHKHKDYADIGNRAGVYHNNVEGQYLGVASCDYFIPCNVGEIPKRPFRQEKRMMLTFSPSHQEYVDKYFKTIYDYVSDIDFTIYRQNQVSNDGLYKGKGWEEAMVVKLEKIVEYLDNLHDGDIFIYSDVDIQFFGDPFEEVEEYLRFTDIAFQNDVKSMVMNTLPLCAGFMMMRVTKESRVLVEAVCRIFKQYDNLTCDQMAFQYVLGSMGIGDNSMKYITLLPRKKFLTITHDDEFNLVTKDLVMHHGNYRIGYEAKSKVMDDVRKIYNNLP